MNRPITLDDFDAKSREWQQQQQQLQQQQQQQQQQQAKILQAQPPPSTTPKPFPVPTDEKIYQLVHDLTIPERRETALLELSKKRETVDDLAPILWHSVGTVAALLQEIVSIYPLLSPPKLKAHASNRVCNALALLQCVASHPETRTPFIAAHIPLFLYPFLNTVSKTRPFEYLRLTSLGVVGALVKMDDSEVINFLLSNCDGLFLVFLAFYSALSGKHDELAKVLLRSCVNSTEIIPLCLRIMETGSELSKTVATFIVQKILLDELGLNYICATYDRFLAVSSVLQSMMQSLIEQPSVRLLKHIIRCYLRLCDNPRAREALRPMLPDSLRDGTFANVLKDDHTTKRWLGQLLLQLNIAGDISNVVGLGGNVNLATSMNAAEVQQHAAAVAAAQAQQHHSHHSHPQHSNRAPTHHLAGMGIHSHPTLQSQHQQLHGVNVAVNPMNAHMMQHLNAGMNNMSGIPSAVNMQGTPFSSLYP